MRCSASPRRGKAPPQKSLVDRERCGRGRYEVYRVDLDATKLVPAVRGLGGWVRGVHRSLGPIEPFPSRLGCSPPAISADIAYLGFDTLLTSHGR
ncbi:hypothetical protein GQ55_2G403600 [Panicum hallii var. hallii]|uniref:Uncharacterized protein n=1 Tax=Panicum hallii var. hallii TaxID=1504633 RepID=A0A2T7EXJ9_9POAL|nr:hypothetical protein GQ55_2G403600 [Panicum hallii var. hallii]